VIVMEVPWIRLQTVPVLGMGKYPFTTRRRDGILVLP
jgi:hypothetical protein